MPKKNYPKLRFKGFTNAWEQRELGELMEVSSAKRVHRSEWTESGVPFLRSSDVVAAFNHKENEKVFISQEHYDVLVAQSGKLRIGDLLVTGGGSIGVPMLVKTDKPLYFKDADLIWFKNKGALNGNFLFYSFISDLVQDYIKKTAHIGTISHYTIERGKKTPINITPLKDEQAKIGTFFEKLDSLIAANQRKLKKTKALKSAYLSEMFPSKDENKPKLRFAGFTNAWEQRRLDAVFAPIPNNTLSRANLNYTIGKIKNVHYGDILIKYGAVTDCRRDEIPFITGGEIFDYRSQLLQEGDILIADAAEDETVGKATEIAGISNIPVVSGLHTIACRPKVKMQPCYLGYYMNSPSYHQQLLPLMQGIKVLSISRTNLAKTTVFYPISEQEQSQIGRLFAGLDHLITLHQRKLEELQELKKAYLQQMFI
ncbi:restriction endonuclease subunit S [Sporolactobacillus sp. KGMB 08714]|uniref:restriction endonuclease subunit S n=1 Tax=Sporolactobacillus sp. KGMB 08714 TaxID=3064704 RepID=UPI002FBD6061